MSAARYNVLLGILLLLGAARSSAEPAPTGELVVVTRPSGGKVSIDGTLAGASPATVKGLFPGQHLVEVSWSSGASASTVVEVTGEAGQKVTVKSGAAVEPTPATTTPLPATSKEPEPTTTPSGAVVAPPAAVAAPPPPPSNNRSARAWKALGMGMTLGGAKLNLDSLILIAVGASLGNDGGAVIAGGAIWLVISIPTMVVGAILWAINGIKLRRLALSAPPPPPRPAATEIALSSPILGATMGAGFTVPF